MSNYIIGYARVSTQEQNLQMQLDELQRYGCLQIFEEKETGSKKDRPALNDLLETVRPGDTVVVYKLDRISRSTKHLLELSEFFHEKGVNFISIKEGIDTTTPMGRFFFTVMAGLTTLERDIIRERTKSGLASARARGRKGGRPKTASKAVKTALKLYHSKEHSISEIVKMTGVSQATLYRKLKEEKEGNEGK